jgi:hypothetical protein
MTRKDRGSSERVGFPALILSVFDDIDDPMLVAGWDRIVMDYNYFPQSSHEWCSPWWRYMRGGRELHILAVKDGNSIVGLAPLCIERVLGLRVLRSFPIHFGDFYTFLVEKSDRRDAIIQAIAQRLTTFREWDFVRIDQVNSGDECAPFLDEYGFAKKKLTDIIAVGYEGKTFEDYLNGLSDNHRRNLRKRIKRLEKDANLHFEVVTSVDGFLAYYDEMNGVYSKRWGKAYPEQYRECKKNAFVSCFTQKKAVLYLLKANGVIMAFRLGFLYNGTFFSWNICFDPDYAKYSPGSLLETYIVQDIINRAFTGFNFMAGTYDYKAKLAEGGHVSENYSYFLADGKLESQILALYHLKWRDSLKGIYHDLLGYKNSVSKKLIHTRTKGKRI